MQNKNEKIVSCPPCGENVALATKRGANKVLPILPLLPRLTAVLPPQGREITARGFTLIELLVVVLIIGILAAVALPQYQLAVRKSHAVESISLIKVLGMAETAYFLANGEYTDEPEKLDISFQDNRAHDDAIIQDRVALYFTRLSNDPPYLYAFPIAGDYKTDTDRFFIGYILPTGEMFCEVHNSAPENIKKVCKSLGTEFDCPKNDGIPATCYKLK